MKDRPTPTNPSDPTSLASVIDRGKAGGISDDFLATLLSHNGYSMKSVFRAFGAHYASTLGLPSRIERSDNARDAYVYLLDFLMLGSWAFALGNLLYQLIDRYVPDAANRDAYGTLDLSLNIATLLVAFPIYVAIEYGIGRGLARGALSADSGVRRWLTYVTLVLTASCELGDLIWFLTAFLRGEMTARFVLQTATVSTLSLGIFAYYLAGLRRTDRGA